MSHMHGISYEGVVIRPPSEAESLILQITLGCSDNACIFCPAYKEKAFSAKATDRVIREIQQASLLYPETRKLFFADGDALILPHDTLLRIFDATQASFPRLSRIGIYGSIKSLERKSAGDLAELKKRKLGIVYLGFETGDRDVYTLTKKYGSPEKNVETCIKVKEAGIKTNVTVILGLGGRKHSEQHALHTAEILNAARPDQIAALTLIVAPHTPLHAMVKNGAFEPLTDFEFVGEMKTLLENLQDFRCLFFSNHASNYYLVNARFPKDRQEVLRDLSDILREKRKASLTPDFMRGL